jgi:hypothetical protein
MVWTLAKRFEGARPLGTLGREVVSAVRCWRKKGHAVGSWLPPQREHVGADEALRRVGMGGEF